jgi:ABC-type dipeptide/oligopeptide/nickel transport system permease subunit
LSIFFIVGIVLFIVSCFLKEGNIREGIAIFGAILALPCFIYAYILTILHWKERYVGDKSTLWGILLLIETTGWFKLVYIFRHIIADINQTGRYEASNKSE